MGVANGRVYDPLTAQFFSPDPFIQAPGNWRNYNRYGYCMNNPTKYTDPSGYIMAQKDYVWFDSNASNWMSAGGGGGGGSTLAVWDAQHRGSISSIGDGKYEYANGDKATYKEAFDMYHFSKVGEKSSTYGFNHLYTMMSDGKLILAGSNGGEITGIKNGSFETTNKNTIACQLSPTLFQMAYADDWNSGSGESGSYLENGLINHITNPSVDFLVGATEYKVGQILTNRVAYGKFVSPIIVRTAVANINVSAKALQVTGNILKGTGIALGAAGLGITGYDIYQNGLNLSNGTDFVMGCVGFVPGWGWAVSGTYFLGKATYEYLNEQ